MFLLNSCLSLFSAAHLWWAPLLPKLRGHFAEFLDNTSLAGLRILFSSTCVGLRYGHYIHNSGFSRHSTYPLRYLNFAPHRTIPVPTGICLRGGSVLTPVFPLPGWTSSVRPHSSVMQWCRNLHLLSIGYAFQPRLRPRLTQGRSALPWKPRTFGRKDSHLTLATHSGILPSYPSTAPFGTASSVLRMLPYRSYYCTIPRLRCRVLAPDIFGAGPLD